MILSPFDFFQRKTVLTCDDVEWCAAQTEFGRVGLDGYQKFLALGDIGPHQSFNRSTKTILSEFWASGQETLLFLEDDCVFRELSHLGSALSELPDDWDIVYLGANLMNDSPEKHSEHLHRVRSAWTTHAVGYNRKVVPFLLENQPPFSEEMYDCWLSRQLGNVNAFVVSPMVAWQRSRWSTIWAREVDYHEIFEESQAKLA